MSAYAALPDFETFGTYASRARAETLSELQHADLATSQRVIVYSWGAAEGFLLDRVNPKWKDSYFKNLFTLDPYFDGDKPGPQPPVSPARAQPQS